ncbi:MAG: bacteriocin-like protein [Mucilaginibacter sp.]
MEKFSKLSRAEMKNVTGGIMPICIMYCNYNDGRHNHIVQSSVQACTDEFEAACTFGGSLVSCSCTTI